MRSIPILMCAIILAACGSKDATPAADSTSAMAPASGASAMASTPDSAGASASSSAPGGAMATIKDAAGRDLGMLMLTDAGDGISVSGTLRGLTPGEHGIHLHTIGMCEGPAFTTAGGHWNPTAKMHGTESPNGSHLGDLMNITVGADSTATVQLTAKGGSLHGTQTMLMDTDGAAIVVHAKADDYKTDPSGNSGDRIACGMVSGS